MSTNGKWLEWIPTAVISLGGAAWFYIRPVPMQVCKEKHEAVAVGLDGIKEELARLNRLVEKLIFDLAKI